MNFSARLQREWSKLRAVKASKGPEEELEVDLSPRVSTPSFVYPKLPEVVHARSLSFSFILFWCYSGVEQSELDLNLWTASIRGPPDSPFEDHLFQLRLSIPPRYPLQPPKVFFVTRVCHPNVHFKVCRTFLLYTRPSKSEFLILSSWSADWRNLPRCPQRPVDSELHLGKSLPHHHPITVSPSCR